MAITRVATRNLTNLGGSTSYSFSHAGGVCDVAFVMTVRAFVDVSGVTYGGQNMTLLSTVTNGNGVVHSLWGLQAAPAGTQTVVISAPSASNVQAGVITYSGVSASATFPNVANTNSSGSTSSVTTSLTTTINNCILVGFGGRQGSGASSVSEGTGTTNVSFLDNIGQSWMMVESNPLSTGTAGSKSLQVVSGDNADMVLAVIALAPSVSSPSPSPSASQSPSSSVSSSVSLSPSASISKSPSASPSPSSSVSSSASPSVSSSVSASISPSSSISLSPSSSSSSSPSPSPTQWMNSTKHSSAITNQSKNAATWANGTKDASSWANNPKTL